MLSPQEVDPFVVVWRQALGGPGHRTAQAALAYVVTALLVGQCLRPASLARALPSPHPVPARARFQQVARAWRRRWLTAEYLTPLLVRAALALATPAGQPHLALDTVRCGAWEIFTIGLVWHGRVLPLGWAVLPYPLPKGRFTPTACALIQRLAAAWPADRPPHLLADRGFPSQRLFRTLHTVGWDFTIRLRASDVVTVAGAPTVVRDLLAPAAAGAWSAHAGRFGKAAAGVAATVVIGRGLAVLRWHQRDAGSARARARQAAQRAKDLRHKHRGQHSIAQQTDPWLVLFTTQPTWLAAVRSYKQRHATEGTYRDAQSGWDGQHGWGVETRLPQVADPVVAEGTFGLWALGTLIQSWVGDQVGQPVAPTVVRATTAEWTTTGRLSVWARGRLAVTDPSGRLRLWLTQTLVAGAIRLATDHAVPVVPPLPQQEAA